MRSCPAQILKNRTRGCNRTRVTRRGGGGGLCGGSGAGPCGGIRSGSTRGRSQVPGGVAVGSTNSETPVSTSTDPVATGLSAPPSPRAAISSGVAPRMSSSH